MAVVMVVVSVLLAVSVEELDSTLDLSKVRGNTNLMKLLSGWRSECPKRIL